MFFDQMWSGPKPETTTLSSQAATGLQDLKSPSFSSETDRGERERRNERGERERGGL